MGGLLMTTVQSLELSDIVKYDYSMEKINQALLKYVINSNIKLRDHYDNQIDDVHERFTFFELTSGKVLKSLESQVNKLDTEVRVRLSKVEEDA